MNGIQMSEPAASILGDVVERMGRMGYAVKALTAVVQTARLIDEFTGNSDCKDEIARLNSDFVLGGINEAIGIVADEMSFQVERLTELLDEGNIISVRKNRKSMETLG
jgi:hypothetical protein